MKFCKDCRHYDANTEKCGKAVYEDPVTAQKKTYYASIERMSLIGCGLEGKNWEAREKATA